MTTPAGISMEERVTALETRLDTILPTRTTKEDISDVRTDIARLEGKMDAMNERLEGKTDASNERMEEKFDSVKEWIYAMEYRLLIKFTGITATLLAIAVVATRFL